MVRQNQDTGMSGTVDGASMDALLDRMSREGGEIIRKQLEATGEEYGRKAVRVGIEAGYLCAGGLVAYTGFAFLAKTCERALEEVIPKWASSLVMAGILGGTGLYWISEGMGALRKEQVLPKRATDIVRQEAGKVMAGAAGS
jgi:hypothetical protein